MTEFLSIGIPARNEQDSIERVIRNVIKSIVWRETPAERKELIVCVNGSKDKTEEIVKKLSQEIPQIRLLVVKEAGKNSAINTITRAANARAREIYFSDADVLVKRDTIGKVLQELRSAGNKIEFAAPISVTSASFMPASKRSPTSALHVEAIRIAKKERLSMLCGAGFAVKRRFLLENPLPKHPLVDDIFINLAYPGKIKIVYDATVIYRQPSLKGQFEQRVRFEELKKSMLEAQPDLKERAAQDRKVYNPRKLAFFRQLGPKAKVGFVLNRAVELAASIAARRKRKEVWPTVKSTKLVQKKVR